MKRGPLFLVLHVLEGRALVGLGGAASSADLSTTAGDVGLGVASGLAGSSEVLLGITAVLLTAEQEGVLAGGGDQSELIEGEALAAGGLDGGAGSLGEAEGSNAEGGDLVKTDVIGDVADNDGDGGSTLEPDGLALHADSDAAKGDWGAVVAALNKAGVDGLVEGRVGALGEELVELDQQLDVGVGAQGVVAHGALLLLDAGEINTHDENSPQ
eukprot:GILK01008021.1.p1 GENE.GILK01008021.1~~GILK01008021.1.p1  ORF type:complete len:213 (+),score=23.23 GILK01008021.1:42-680(+)